MIRIWLLVNVFVFSALPGFAADCDPPEVLADNLFPSVKLATSMGDIVVELNRRRAPASSNNFLRYALDGLYDNTIFHRVIPDFVVQGGGYDKEFNERPTFPAVINESGNGLKNNQWTIAMARFEDPHSAKAQFYFNLQDNDNLDPSSRHWGYTVFGEVIEGQDILQKIAGVKTHYSPLLDAPDVPESPVMLNQVTVLPADY